MEGWHQGRIRITQQNHVGHVARHITAAFHGNPQFRLLERQSIVDPVTHHGHIVPLAHQFGHNPLFLLRGDAPKHGALIDHLSKFMVGQAIELEARHGPQRCIQARLLGQGGHRLRVITRNNFEADALADKRCQRLRCLRAQFIADGHQCHRRQRRQIHGQGCMHVGMSGKHQHPQALIGPVLSLGHQRRLRIGGCIWQIRRHHFERP